MKKKYQPRVLSYSISTQYFAIFSFNILIEHILIKKKREKSSLPALKCQSCLKIDTYKVLQTLISPSYDIITAQFGLRSQKYLNCSADQLKDAAIQWRAFKLNKYCITFTFPFTIPLMLMFVCIQSRNLTFYSYHSDNQNCHSRDKYFRSSPTRGGEITGGFWYSHLNMGVNISTFSSLPRSVTTSVLFALLLYHHKVSYHFE